LKPQIDASFFGKKLKCPSLKPPQPTTAISVKVAPNGPSISRNVTASKTEEAHKQVLDKSEEDATANPSNTSGNLNKRAVPTESNDTKQTERPRKRKKEQTMFIPKKRNST